MNVSTAVKIGVAVVIGTKLAVGSFKWCRMANRYQQKWDYLVEQGYWPETLMFKSEAELDKLMEQLP